jgi:hypothetical protein
LDLYNVPLNKGNLQRKPTKETYGFLLILPLKQRIYRPKTEGSKGFIGQKGKDQKDL